MVSALTSLTPQAARCVPLAVMRSAQQAQVPRIGAAAERMRVDVVYLKQML